MCSWAGFDIFELLLLFSCSVCLILCDPVDCSMPGFPNFTISQSLPKFMSIESVMPSNFLILWCPLFLLSSIFPSIRVFSNELALHIRWPNYWSFSITPLNEYSRLISFQINSLISLLSKGLWKVFSSTTIQKHQFFCTHLLYGPTLTCIEKPYP